MHPFLEKLQAQAEENPALAMGVTAGLISAISQFMNAYANVKNSGSWDRETKRRVKNLK